MKTTFSHRRLWLTLAACTVLATGIAAAGKGKWHHHDPHEMGEKIASHLEDKLNLNDEQEEQVAAIIAAAVEKHRTMQESSPLHEAWEQDTLDADTLHAALEAQHSKEAQAARRSEQLALRAEALAQIHAVLTPTQREAALPMIVRHLSYGMGRHGGRHGGHHYSGHGKRHHDEHHD